MKYPDKIKDHVRHLGDQTPEEQVSEVLSAMEEIDRVDTDGAYRAVDHRIADCRRNPRILQILTRAAAVLFLPLLLVTVWSITRNGDTQSVEFTHQEITTPSGMRSQIVLPDGSKVWLNAESTIGYSIPFSVDERLVDLKGEAFFEVAADREHPMVITSGNARLRVTGTSFNVKAYADEEVVEVSLLEGGLKLSLLSDVEEKNAYAVVPGNHVSVSGSKISVRNENLDKYASWRYGNLVFDETPMPEMVRKLERWYGVDVVLKDERLYSYRFTTTFIDQSLPQVLELLELSSPISIDYQPGSYDKSTHVSAKGIVYIDRKK
jgi:ferric-dicitrate binding protein FerR (iron transport regulator)